MQKDNITFDVVMSMDVRIGYVTEVEKVKKADKLYKLEVDFGDDLGVRTVVSAIAEHFEEDELINNSFPFVVNLEPRKIRGIESQAMILLAENHNGHYLKIGNNLESDKGAVVL